MDKIYKNIKENNQNKKRKILIIFHDMIADMISNNPGNIRLEGFKSSKLQDFKSSRRLQDVLIKTHIFVLLIHLQKTS